ncbi:MAG: nitrate reductase subunit alpha [Mycobacterium pseudokansasii]|uniref:nitrate reductase subunit alpha n=1 Tax=Mycobacterium pseudokansasii TaxID=2341080 RepID=UPI0007B53DB7|nr:nitrate reductase subunit alpha [Mycobacterium pseudokansasii]KZS66367.1 nitrate reductase subunit alpha [Mycobacterium kansasii]MBY0389759.1 nitrate reductase subunit alpha [Mycobacterium pseudokansasii]VAZ97953.1 Nitrate reductase alpha subunit [Mycobacterium pseudokansasii]VAZ99495.1 Nitrate reductase alpha subunit [Mycobacterium pseudokansasii]
MVDLPTSREAAADALLRLGRYFHRGEISADQRTLHKVGGRSADDFYRDRWAHDKVVRSTHGVNCTGSCSWKIYVKDGVITWESQQTDYPSVGASKPEYEPRGCPRGASFSWYTYSPARVRYPYVRSILLQYYREAKERLNDPVLAWADIVDDPVKSARYKQARGKGGFVRAEWWEAAELAAAAHVYTIKKYGPDRVSGFSPIPAMSMVSHAVGARFISLIGGSMLSFYDWYADLPVASPQVFGDQTDVPESADWFDASYLIMWGSNVPVTRTPDAHFMTEARYRGQKVVVVSPDYADNTKFADEWLPARPGTDGALAMSMGHVILKEFFVDRPTPYFTDYVKKFTDLPFLVTLAECDGGFVPGKFLTAADLGDTAEGAEFKTVVLDADANPRVPNGSLGYRFTASGEGNWNLDLHGMDPLITLCEVDSDAATVLLPRFDGDSPGVLVRGVPTRLVAGQRVTTVFDLLLAQYGVHREGLPGTWPTGYGDAAEPYTPAWQESITGVPARAAERVAREFASNAERSGGRSMILMGAGTNHWFHSDQIYRSFLTLIMLTGCQGVNGGGWAHYVGQEKCRPVTGWSTLAFGLDWQRPPRQMQGTVFWYLATDQWRYDRFTAEVMTSPLADGRFAGRTAADNIALASRLGWMPSYPTFNRNPLDLADEAMQLGKDPSQHIVDGLTSGHLRFACEDPDAPENFPRCLTVWRANLLGSSAKGNEYFLKHLLGTDSNVAASDQDGVRPQEVRWRDEAPIGKLDLLLSLDFRNTSTTLFSDIVLPAATWYEKHDLSSTDMHPFVHAFSPAISPPWETKTDFEAFHRIARGFSWLAEKHLGKRKDIVAVPLQHDSADATAQPGGRVMDWKAGECEPIPGKTMPRLVVVERDYPAVAEKLAALGPMVETVGLTVKGVTTHPEAEVEYLRGVNGAVVSGVAAGRPSLAKDTYAAEAILALSGTTNGRLAVEGFKALQRRTGIELADLAKENEGKRISFADTQSRPVAVNTSPEWSGSESGGRRYSPFTINTERLKPWHTLTGRQHFYLDHDWMSELGEQLPIFRPPLDMTALFDEPVVGNAAGDSITVRYLTPHSKWSIHSSYQDNLHMLTLSRGGQAVWMSDVDAEKIGVKDNDWIEATNRNGVVNARAIVSHRIPEGVVFMYHAQDKAVDVPRTEKTGKRGGIHNALTRVMIKPSHLIGGYAQQSFALNYHGPTGNQRDEVTTIRRRSQEVTY